MINMLNDWLFETNGNFDYDCAPKKVNCMSQVPHDDLFVSIFHTFFQVHHFFLLSSNFNLSISSVCCASLSFILATCSVITWSCKEATIAIQKHATVAHRAMFKLGTKNLFVFHFWVQNMPAVHSSDRCNF